MHIGNTKTLSLTEIRKQWAEAWGITPHRYIGRKMLERSLEYKVHEQNGFGLTPDQNKRLKQLVTAYKRNPHHFDQGHTALKKGMRLIRNWKEKNYSVTVTEKGFLYNEREYSSLSTIASEITGSRWNGWVFFGLKKLRGAE